MKAKLLLFAIVLSANVFSQVAWENSWYGDSLVVYPWGVAEYSDTSFLTVSLNYDLRSETGTMPHFIVFGTNADTILEKFDYPLFNGPFQIFKLSDNSFILYDSKWSNNRPYIEVAKIDHDLNTVWYKQFALPDTLTSTNSLTYLTEHNNGNISFAFNLSHSQNYDPYLLLNLSANGDSLSAYASDLYTFLIFGIQKDFNGGLNIVGGDPNGQASCISKFNDQLQYSGYYNLTPYIESAYNEIGIYQPTPDTVVTIHKKIESNIVTVKLIKWKINGSQISKIYENVIELSSTMADPLFSLREPFLPSKDGGYYIVNHEDFGQSRIIKTDAYFNEVWRLDTEHSNLYYMYFNIVTTSDGGLLINFMAAVEGNGDIISTHFLKIGPNGEIPLQTADAPIKIKNHFVYPNPGSSSFTLSVPDVQAGSYLKVYDMHGRLAFQTTINQTQTQIDASTWPVGLYLYTLQNGRQTQSGKWIKE